MSEIGQVNYLRVIPDWYMELKEELQKVVQKHALKHQIDILFVKDSKTINEGIDDIAMRMTQLPTDPNAPLLIDEEKKIRRALRKEAKEKKKMKEAKNAEQSTGTPEGEQAPSNGAQEAVPG